MPTVLVVAGTRPECIKLASVVAALDAQRRLRRILLNSGQHEAAVGRTFAEFDLNCDLTLAQLPSFARLAAGHEHMARELRAVLLRTNPDVVVVQGDTLTAYAAARAAHEMGRVVAHVEAGLRTTSSRDPFPEEWFRRQIGRWAHLHFAPCASAVANLRREGIAEDTIHAVGNTGIDSLRAAMASLEARVDGGSQRVLVTLHRRENYDQNAAIVCDALVELVAARPAVSLLFPVHPNPRVANVVRRRLASLSACQLVDPLGYRDFIRAARDAALIISDSGGIQEEAPHLGTPLLVPRANTERPESLRTGFVRLVDVRADAIVGASIALLDAPRRQGLPIEADAPYGGGDAGRRIVVALEAALMQRACA